MPGICLDCRVVTEADDRCELPGHTTVSLMDPRGRERLLRQAWGRRFGLRPVGIALAPFAIIAGATLGLLSDLGPYRRSDLTHVLVGGGIGLGLFLLSSAWRRPRWAPVGAGARRTPPGGSGVRGRASSGEGGDTRLASSLVLRPSSASSAPTMILERSHGFVLEADDGTVVEIPKGRIRVVADPRHRGKCSGDDVLREVWRVDPTRSGDAPPPPQDPLPWHRAELVRVMEGDEIELLAELEHAPPRGGAKGYRDAGRRRRVAAGVPIIRIVHRPEPGALGAPAAGTDGARGRPRRDGRALLTHRPPGGRPHAAGE